MPRIHADFNRRWIFKISNGEKVAKLGLSSAVKFLGIRDDIQNLMHAMDLFLFPSLFEGLPVVLIEAQAAGLKCLVSDAITRESDVSERVQFMSLKQPPDVWASEVLSSTYEHEDTSEMLRTNGYDTDSMTKWLTDYYLQHGLYTKQA